MPSPYLAALSALVVGTSSSLSSQSLLYNGIGSPEGSVGSLSTSSAEVGFRFDTPNAGELLIDTRGGLKGMDVGGRSACALDEIPEWYDKDF